MIEVQEEWFVGLGLYGELLRMEEREDAEAVALAWRFGKGVAREGECSGEAGGEVAAS